MRIEKERFINRNFLRNHPEVTFVFGDNLLRRGYGGAASLRDEVNTYGFITKKYPSNHDSSFYRVSEYMPVFGVEIEKLKSNICSNPNKQFLISKIGGGLANRYGIFEEVISLGLPDILAGYVNVSLLWD